MFWKGVFFNNRITMFGTKEERTLGVKDMQKILFQWRKTAQKIHFWQL